MTIAKFNERMLLDSGLGRQEVATLRHLLQQVGNQIGAPTLPYVVNKAEILDLRAALTQDLDATGAAEVEILSLPVTAPLKAGATLSGRIVGVTSNGETPGTLNLWLSVGGVKVLAHAFTTPDIPGSGKGFAADFTVTVRAPGSVMAGGVLSLAYNAPTVLPAVSAAPVAIPAGPAVVELGMNWTAADPANTATAKIAYLSAEKL